MWPGMPIKIGKFAMIVDWPDQVPLFNIEYRTKTTRDTQFSTLFVANKIIGPFYWLSQYRMEVLKNDFQKRQRL